MDMYINKVNGSEKDISGVKFRSFYVSAKEKLKNGYIKEAYNDFDKAKIIYGCAYCRFIEGKTEETFKLLKSIEGLNPFVNWILCLAEIVQNDIKHVPTYFQIRNFYEQDMNMLFLYKNYDFIKKIINNIGYLECFNKEIYKFTARVFMDNEGYKQAYNFLKKSIEICYNDPEVHVMMGDIYLYYGDKVKAQKEYKKSIDVAGWYYPASKRLSEILHGS